LLDTCTVEFEATLFLPTADDVSSSDVEVDDPRVPRLTNPREVDALASKLTLLVAAGRGS
jgi:hypothetical protein